MSSNALALVGSRATQQPDYTSREVINTIKLTVAKGATDAQLAMFLEVAKSTGLNPFLKEIWYVPDKGIIMAGRDGYLRVANEHPMFDGMETRIERDEEKKLPIKAVCTVWRKDRSHPTVCEAYFNEYNKGSGAWATYKSAMIGKVAEALALKRSFSINGAVTEEEIGEQTFEAHPEPAGSVEAAQEVAKRKIAEMKAGKATDTALPALAAGPDPAEAYDNAIERAKELLKKYVGDSTDMTFLNSAYPLFWDAEKWAKVAKLHPDKIQAGNDKLKAFLDERSSTLAVWQNQFDMLRDFAEQKERVGEETYYAVLKLHGVEKSNEFKTPVEGIKCFMDLRKVEVAV